MRRGAGIEREFASRVGQRALKLFGHVERMDKYSMGRSVKSVRCRARRA